MTAGTSDIVKSLVGRLLGLDGHTDSQETDGQYAPFLTGDCLRGLRLFKMNKTLDGASYKVSHPVLYARQFDDFLGYALNAYKWHALAGSNGGTGQTPALLVGTAEGAVQLETGGGSTYTMAVQGSQLVGARNFLVSNGETKFEAALGTISAITDVNANFGLIDAVTLSVPFTISGVTVTATSTNAACFVLDDLNATAKTLYAVSINAGGTAQITKCAALNNQPAPSTYTLDTAGNHAYRVDIDNAGNANYYIDGTLVATQLLAVATTALLAPSVGIFSQAAGGNAQTLLVDYILAEQLALRG
jgi:hypothetical protein